MGRRLRLPFFFCAGMQGREALFVELDEHFGAVSRWNQEEIDLGAVGAGTFCWIDRNELELFAQDCCGAVDVGTAKLNLLDTRPLFGKESGDGAGRFGFARGE